MEHYRAEIEGHIVEAVRGAWGGERVLLDGRVVSDRPFAGFRPAPHAFELADPRGGARPAEVRFMDRSAGLGLRVRVLLLVSGAERCILQPWQPGAAITACAACGYSLAGLPVENAEVRCPECGRHTPAAMLGLAPDAPGVSRPS